ncbi:twin-arginine translocase subunit TatC [Oceanibacterium hippocampi]|uniref:Sec-independent protein translocase protein TatC n=1 Tax=Oceanibacterium hippocampi TaxID=745714 RepID=A0A1Y5U555_9PROT|nr:twin-arginine translocase subunit TatC [Oceanibacterium hippocampi]SLN77218.1 Sec-independent protein translocase protein TatC [Oceanibacterium hippocampi]
MHEQDVDASKAPLLDHIIELRNRLMWASAALFIAFIACYLVSEQIYAILMRPLVLAFDGDLTGRRMIFTAPQEAFFTYLKVSFWAAAFISFPIIAAQIWMFVAPGLYKNERRAFMPFLVVTPILFFLGGAMVYFLVMPLALHFFTLFESRGTATTLPIELETKVSEYLSLIMKLIFAFGLCFELPVFLTLLGRAGIVTSTGLAQKRKYAIVCVFVVAAVLTPPDPISQISLALPILLLYEISIWCVRAVEKKRAEREAAEEAELSGEKTDGDGTSGGG